MEAYLPGRGVFVSAPSGAGKSLTFELAPYAFDCLNGDHANSNSIVLVVVPLISLMKDQGDDCSEQQLQDILDLKVKLVFGSSEVILNNYRHIVVPPFSTSMNFLDDLKLSVTSRIFRTTVSFLSAQFRHKMFVKSEPSPLDISFPAINSRFKLWSFFGHSISSIFV